MGDAVATSAQFLEIMRRYGEGLRRVARVYAARTNETDDLLQEIAIAVFRALPTHRGACSERTFVFRVAHNRGITFAQTRRRAPALSETDDPPGESRPSEERSPEDELGHRRDRERLWRAIDALPYSARAVLALALEGMSHEEIGEVLGLQTNAVSTRISRARDALRKLMIAGGP